MTEPIVQEVEMIKGKFQQAILKNACQVKTAGWILILLGFAAVTFPVMGSLAVELFVSWLILFSGVAQLSYAITHRGTVHFWLTLLFGVVSTVLGVIMAAKPVIGMVTLTSLMAAWFIISGTYKCLAAFQLRPAPQWFWMLFNGLITIILGYYIIIKFDSTVDWILGLFFGIDAIFAGATILSLISHLKSVATEKKS